MPAVKPLVRRKEAKKKTTPFKRFQWDRHAKLNQRVTWRKPRGIDSCIRRRFKGRPDLVNVGFRNNKKTRHVLPNGFKKFRVFNARELDVLLMQNRVYAAEIAHGVSSRKRMAIVQRAAQLNIKVTNGNAKINTEESS
eukprot:CAMPEP_0171462744 /NCGR_PEP_ID=MMETSP0945-20130129/6653_1 /TAXON_ID=109269 /ORGANISM="Vaucheria litorea, Strain CCMP2940" /LENGTH=137 /DNA_ID=CAMNT_0011989319 /DNA_START=45 /DNA_END=458 /DNA_ORIENTATION=-